MLYSVSMSLDGFIAGPDGDMSWLTPHLSPNPLVEQIISQIGALLVGNRTYGGDDPHRGTEREGKAFGGGWEGPQFVLTHHPSDSSRTPGTTFVDNLPDAVAAARDAAGERYVNVLGADVARQCLRAGLIDEVLTMVTPVLLGGGTPLFHDVDGGHVRLRRKPAQPEYDSSGQVANLWYEVV